MNINLIIPAAGVGQRFTASTGEQSDAPTKVEALLGDQPMFLRSIECFKHRNDVTRIILAVNPDRMEAFRFAHGDRLGFLGVKVVPGGRRERWESVLAALDAVDDDCTHIAVHDAARPLAGMALVDRVFEAAQRHRAVVPGLPVSHTLKRVVDPEGDTSAKQEDDDPLDAVLGDAGKTRIQTQLVAETIDRRHLVEVQTPQVFEADLLRRAYAAIAGEADVSGVTDDASLVEALGEPVRVVEGEAINMKITRSDDLKLAEAYLAASREETAAKSAAKRLFADEEE